MALARWAAIRPSGTISAAMTPSNPSSGAAMAMISSQRRRAHRWAAHLLLLVGREQRVALLVVVARSDRRLVGVADLFDQLGHVRLVLAVGRAGVASATGATTSPE